MQRDFDIAAFGLAGGFLAVALLAGLLLLACWCLRWAYTSTGDVAAAVRDWGREQAAGLAEAGCFEVFGVLRAAVQG